MTLYHSTFRWFDASSCKATPVVQLTTVSTILITACRTLLLPMFCFSAHYGHLAVSVTRNVPFAGAFAVRQLTDKVNAGAKPPECTSASLCP